MIVTARNGPAPKPEVAAPAVPARPQENKPTAVAKKPDPLPEKIESVPQNEERVWPFRFFKSKQESSGNRDIMDLFAFAGELDLDQLKEFCRERKQKSKASAFYYVVIFDTEANARFPSNPFTAEFGIDEGALRHIRAVYVYNRKNGFSELRHYSTNAWDSAPTIEKL